MNRTLPLIPSRHAALLPAPPPSRHVVGVKAWGVKRERETGAEIRDHPPSPPVSITVSVAAVARVAAYSRPGAGIVAMAALSAVKPRGVFCEAEASLSATSFLPLCRSSVPDSSRAFVSIRVPGSLSGCRLGRQVESPGTFINNNIMVLYGSCRRYKRLYGAHVLATGSPGRSLCRGGRVIVGGHGQ